MSTKNVIGATTLVLLARRKDYIGYGVPGGKAVVFLDVTRIDGTAPETISVSGVAVLAGSRPKSDAEKFAALEKRAAADAVALEALRASLGVSAKPVRTAKPVRANGVAPLDSTVV